MNTNNIEKNNYIDIAESYYRAMCLKEFDEMASYLHEDIQFIGPLATMSGKASVVSAAKGLSEILQDIQIRARFRAHNQIMLAYDFLFPAPIGTLRAAVLMTFIDQQIASIELFYDARPFEEKKHTIFKDAT